MPPPTPLAISTSSLVRLDKELQSYHTELKTQEASLAKLKASAQAGPATNGDADDGNVKFQIAQEERAVEETKRLFGPLGEKVRLARGKLEVQVEEDEKKGTADEAEVKRAREVLESTKGDVRA